MYKPKTIIEGYKLGFPGKKLFAVPSKSFSEDKVQVEWEGEVKEYNKDDVLTFRTFQDKFNINEKYTLVYFEK